MSADRAYNCHELHVELFIDEMGWLIDDRGRVLLVFDLGPLGLYEEIYDARAPCTSYATENTDYLTGITT